jgi:predicted histone-like DNA-binding protein
MAIQFKALKRGQPGVAGGGVQKYYAAPVMSGEMDLEGLTQAIEKISTVSGADIRAVLYALVDVSVSSLGNGQIVRLGDLGSIRVTFKSKGVATAEEVTANLIHNPGVVFTPGMRIKKAFADVKYRPAPGFLP